MCIRDRRRALRGAMGDATVGVALFFAQCTPLVLLQPVPAFCSAAAYGVLWLTGRCAARSNRPDEEEGEDEDDDCDDCDDCDGDCDENAIHQREPDGSSEDGDASDDEYGSGAGSELDEDEYEEEQ